MESKQSKIQVIPYALTEKGYPIDDQVLSLIWKQIVNEGLDKKVFPDNSISTVADFLGLMKDTRNIPVFAFDGKLLGLAWLNSVHDKHALAHFCMMREAWGKKTLQVGQEILKYWNSFDVLDVIIGNTPSDNKLAIKYIQKLGFTVIGEIPTIGKVSYLELKKWANQVEAETLERQDSKPT